MPNAVGIVKSSHVMLILGSSQVSPNDPAAPKNVACSQNGQNQANKTQSEGSQSLADRVLFL